MALVAGKMRLDIPDSADDNSKADFQYFLPVGDFNVQIDLSNYTPDDSDDGCTSSLYCRDAAATNFIQIHFQSDNGSPIYRSRMIHIIDGGAAQYGDISRSNTAPTMLRIIRDSNDLKAYVYVTGTGWVHLATADFDVHASELDRIKIIIADTNSRGGYADFDNLAFNSCCPAGYPKAWTTTSSTTTCTTTTTSSSSSTSSTASTLSTSSTSSSLSTTTTTYWCEYNETFEDLDHWQITDTGQGETAAIVGNKVRLDVPVATNGEIKLDYQYYIGTGDFDVEVELSNYTPDDDSKGIYAVMRAKDDNIGDDFAHIQYRLCDAGTEHRVESNLTIAGEGHNDYAILTAQPTKFRVTRSGTTVAVYAYDSGWTQIDSMDFAGRAANLEMVDIRAVHNGLEGGSFDMDNLRFRDGCPAGYPKAWTTTSTTTTTCTTTSTPPV